MQYLIKTIITAIVIVGISEIGKKFSLIAAILASLPLVSILAMIWLYTDTKDIQKIIDLSSNIFWAVLPSLIFFLVLPILLKNDFKFSTAMVLSAIAMFIAYSIYVILLQKFGIKL
ncbi:DUF3147 family protein [Patescibacteria group bacterium AH-259-L05]|nr:DUF3147 family protein [Patescibacteria group bacterium AH-259-L05]